MAVCAFLGTFAWTDTPGSTMGGTDFVAYFPFLTDIEGMRWLIVGGGDVVSRKVRNLLPYGTVVEMVSPDVCPGLDALVQDNAYTDVLKLTRKEFGDRGLDGADFVIVATPEPGLNSEISVLCRSKGIPVNMVDVEEGCPLIFPSIMRGDPVMVGTSTGDVSSVIARYLKAGIQSTMPDGLGDLTARLESYRKTVKDLFPDPLQVRSTLFHELAEGGLSYSDCFTQEQA